MGQIGPVEAPAGNGWAAPNPRHLTGLERGQSMAQMIVSANVGCLTNYPASYLRSISAELLDWVGGGQRPDL
jgi:hypothetical protein